MRTRKELIVKGLNPLDARRLINHIEEGPLHEGFLMEKPFPGETLALIMEECFVWHHTPEGRTYWEKVYEAVAGTSITAAPEVTRELEGYDIETEEGRAGTLVMVKYADGRLKGSSYVSQNSESLIMEAARELINQQSYTFQL